ncbi:uncharacterized protein [Battus philenor]|uniref:uncharacterized protein n=1 Tax=Battus philenor TaxID=42288 RepID=UPI0035D0525C
MDCKEGPLNQVKVNIEGKTWDVDMCNFKNNVTEELQNSTAYMFLDTIRQECFSENSTYTPQVGEDLGPRPYCPRTFDGFSCWVETAASTIAMNPCPDFIVGFDAKQTALKSCTKNGTWDLDPQILPGWTNYKNCINVKNGYEYTLYPHQHPNAPLCIFCGPQSAMDNLVHVCARPCGNIGDRFFAKVVLVLIEKLHTTLRRSRAATARKIFRAAGILIIPWIVPFFGLHMILQPLRPILDSPNTEFYQRFAAGASCLQGLYIATLFCLSNKEVMDELKKRVIKRWRKRAANALIARRNTARRNMIQAIREEVV